MHDRFVIGLLEYHRLLRDAEITDQASRACRASDLDTIFVSTNIEERATGTLSSEQRTLNDLNVDRALMRFEFFQCLVRVAVAKYIKQRQCADVSEALERLIDDDIRPHVPPEALHDGDAFRRARLYGRATSEVLSKNQASLRAIFEHYALGADQQGITAEGRRLSLAEWGELMSETGMYDDDLTKHRADLCFIWSLPFVTDELKRRLQLTQLDFVSFLEALCRLTTFKRMPTDEVLKECKALTVPHWFQQAEAGKHEGAAMLRPVTWQEEELLQAPMTQQLEALIALLLDRLDPDHDGNVTRRELKKRKSQAAIGKSLAIANKDLEETVQEKQKEADKAINTRMLKNVSGRGSTKTLGGGASKNLLALAAVVEE